MDKSVCCRPKKLAPKYIAIEAAALRRTQSVRSSVNGSDETVNRQSTAYLKRSASVGAIQASRYHHVGGVLATGRSASFVASTRGFSLAGEIWVVRHGETAENKTRTIAGHNAGGLTELGRQQAGQLADRLRGTSFDAIFVSDLQRTQETAHILMEALRDCPMHLDNRLREKGGGSLEGKALGTFERMAKQAGASVRTFRAPGGGESWEDVANRSRSFMRTAVEALNPQSATEADACAAPAAHRHAAGDPPSGAQEAAQSSLLGDDSGKTGEGRPRRVLVVTHGGFIRELLNAHVPGSKATNSARNCAVFVIEARSARAARSVRFYLRVSNDASHVRFPAGPALEFALFASASGSELRTAREKP